MKKKYFLHKFMIGLVYPSFLGSVIYNILDKFNYEYMVDNKPRYIIFLLILILYTMDYLYTDTDEVKQDYNIKQLFLDLIVVGLLYWSIIVILDYKRYPNPETVIAITLFLLKLVNLIWEFFRKIKDNLGRLLYSFYLFLYGGVVIINIKSHVALEYDVHSMYSILILLISDVLISIYYDNILYFYKLLTQKKSKLNKKILSLSYPYYDEKILYRESELKEIYNMAKNAYSKKENDQQVFSFDKLIELYKTSPDSWIILKKNQKILGYAHVEFIQEIEFNNLCNGLINENDFYSASIIDDSICTKKRVIHIGSLVVDNNSKFHSNMTVLFLIACLLDKILKMMIQEKVFKIFAVEYEDTNGVSHFKNKLCKFGFKLVGRTKANNNVYVIDITRDVNTYFYSLLNIISSIQKKYYYKDKNFIKSLNSIFS